MIHHLWRLSEAGQENLGLACTDEGLVLGRTPLIELRANQFVVRESSEIERLLSKAYMAEIAAERLMSGLATVASALNANDRCLARIAAVHLRVPDLSSRAARDVMEAEDVLIKSIDWNPALHPRAGTPPNPGWFAPTEAGGNQESFSTRTAQNEDARRRSDASPAGGEDDDFVRLPPGQYIDELRDFLEWLANAKPEEEMAIRAEIKRYFYDVGDTFGGDTLNRVFSDVLEVGSHKELRQQLLNSIQEYAMSNPAQMGQIHALLPGLVSGFPRRGAVPSEVSPRTLEEAPVAQSTASGQPARRGRLGSATTRAQNAAIVAELERQGFTIVWGGGQWPEEYIPGTGPRTLGGTFVDITAVSDETGAVIRVQTVDTLADGRPTARETVAAARIRSKFPQDKLILIPKSKVR